MACEQCIPQIRILLVDDSAANRKFISTLLISHGHKVQTAENGCIAIDKVRDEVFDLILMDIQMPLMSGLEAAAVIRKMKMSAAKSGDHRSDRRCDGRFT
ncbi:response regulator [Plesiomonas shigelloides]|nr:response regulator [Plesiomonas shigelloides]